MADFNIAAEHLLKLEGGYSENDAHGAGCVNYGITALFAVRNGLATKATVKKYIRSMTSDKAKRIYKHYYWDQYNLGEFKSTGVAAAYLSFVVNANTKHVALTLQRAYNKANEWLGVKSSVVEDGVLGPDTIHSINRWMENEERGRILMDKWERQLLNMYSDKGEKLPHMAKGLINRVMGTMNFANQLVRHEYRRVLDADDGK